MNSQELRDLINQYSQSEIAEKSQLTRSYINALATGKRINPTIATVDKIIQAISEIKK